MKRTLFFGCVVTLLALSRLYADDTPGSPPTATAEAKDATPDKPAESSSDATKTPAPSDDDAEPEPQAPRAENSQKIRRKAGTGETGAPQKQYTLAYKFSLGETVRWQVTQDVTVRSTVSNSTQVAETSSKSIKVWRVRNVYPKGRYALAHSVEWVDMLQRVSGREDLRYDSRKDAMPPAGFEQVAESIGVILTTVRMDSQGNVEARRDRAANTFRDADSQMTIPLPVEQIAVGDEWDVDRTISIRMKDASTRKIQIRQTYLLESVVKELATIRITTKILTPVHNPEILVQLVQQKINGLVKFDIDQGRIIEQQISLEDRVIGFQGEASSMAYTSRFVEKLLPPSTETATRPGAARK